MEDLRRLDIIIGMERYNMRMIKKRKKERIKERIGILKEVEEGKKVEIKDKYYGEIGDLEMV